MIGNNNWNIYTLISSVEQFASFNSFNSKFKLKLANTNLGKGIIKSKHQRAENALWLLVNYHHKSNPFWFKS